MVATRKKYDESFKRLFSTRAFMEELLRAFLGDEVADSLEVESMVELKQEHVAKDMRSFRSDVIWKVKFCDRLMYLLILLEHQSRQVYPMSVRMLNYVGLAYTSIIQDRLESELKDEGLPLVLPMVVYNGESSWKAPTQLCEMYRSEVPSWLKKYQPQLEYLLLDFGHMPMTGSLSKRPIMKQFILLHQSQTPEDFRQATVDLAVALKDYPVDTELKLYLRDIVLYYFVYATGNVAAAHDFKDAFEGAEPMTIHAVLRSYRDGLTEARQQGHQEGILQSQRRMAVQLLKEGHDMAWVSALTDVPISTLIELSTQEVMM